MNFCSICNWTSSAIGTAPFGEQPFVDAKLMEQVFARQLLDLLAITEFFKANNASFLVFFFFHHLFIAII